MKKKVEAYRGPDPYIFVSYAHKNADIVHPFISVLQEKYNVWFDEGIHFGREWDDEIMTKIENCNLFLFIVTKESLVSPNCKDELAQARDLNKEFINILVERSLDDELPSYFRLRYSRFQKCYLDSYDSLEEAANALAEKCDAFSYVKAGTTLLQKLKCEVEIMHACLIETDLKLGGKECPNELRGMIANKAFEKKEDVPAHFTPCIRVTLTNASEAPIVIKQPSPTLCGNLVNPNDGEKYSAIGMQFYNKTGEVLLSPGSKKTFSLIGAQAIIAMGAFHQEGGFLEVEIGEQEPIIFDLSRYENAMNYAKNVVTEDHAMLMDNFRKFFY